MNELNLVLTESSNEKTSPERLQEIFTTYPNQEDIKKALTSNPNTPLEILLELAEYYPVEFLKNDALDLYILNNPNLLAEMPEESLASIAKQPEIPRSFILFIFNNMRDNIGILSAISTHPQLWSEWKCQNKDKGLDLKIDYYDYYDDYDEDKAYEKGLNFTDIDLSHSNIDILVKDDVVWSLINCNLNNSTINLQNLNEDNINRYSACDQLNLKLDNCNLNDSNICFNLLVSLSNCNLKNTDIEVVSSEIQKCNIEKCTFNFTPVNLYCHECIIKNSSFDFELDGSDTLLQFSNCSFSDTGIGITQPDSIQEDARAIFSACNFINVGFDNLRNMELNGSNLSGADLSGTDLSGANLSNANLSGANLSGANLSNANLSNANLSGANLEDADLTDANLEGIITDENTKIEIPEE